MPLAAVLPSAPTFIRESSSDVRLGWPVLNAFTICNLSDTAQGAKSLLSAGSPDLRPVA